MSWVYSLSFGPSPFWLRLIGHLLELLRPLLTSRSSSHCRPFRHKARSPQVRTHSFIAQPPDLRRPTLGHKGFTVQCPLALVGNAFYPVLVHRLTIYAPRFLPTLGLPHAVALHFAHCDQLAGGLAPPGVRPCWAHIGIGGSHSRLRPCHTTRHAGPHRAVREFEVMTVEVVPGYQSKRW